MSQFIKALRKVDLCFAEGKTVIENRERWQEVSMKETMQTGMSTTTNSRESSYRHLNAKTPRRNTF
jgi:hypothetical protein